MDPLPPPNWLRSFEAAARLNSFSAAAAELNLTPAAISQQIGLLEKHLGTTLFTRLPRGVALTEKGEAYAIPIRRALADMSEATRGLFGGTRQVVLNVRASISFAALVLAPQLPAFHRKHPHLRIQLTTTVWADRFTDDRFDLDIRFGHGNWAEETVYHLGPNEAQIVCCPQVFECLPQRDVPQLAEAGVVQIVGSEVDWIRLSDMFDLGLPPVSNGFSVDSSLIALQSVAAGWGATMVLEDYARGYIESGALISPFPYRLPIRPSHFAVPRPGNAKMEEVRLFCTWLSELKDG
ncbi:MAG: LysR family transcriptional regulator [Rhodobacteraceae bacterium]|nr:LysR family transcriptional regulator [Paracoccaceae bacterium]